MTETSDPQKLLSHHREPSRLYVLGDLPKCAKCARVVQFHQGVQF
ncbi:predicted protein [Sclerotinia sclerotiorum 1980 UF-70]|uniref:Uncharacterized protein n=1 Tax=Sclerotinia sclerotiorum (strain ATCC 18683 / 1980 / Ss-1) TaxID=665079 RepID=A7F7B3_SCLS1|nr:predicted protein [Sclerotinia sclerotiorum 1980 UF-70]EDN98634.1 predicted protein [Sclerotinia sclerotiorum 1980 UF-70]